MTIHSDDVCPKCTFELTPERICDRDYCPNAFMKRTGKALSLAGVMEQFEHQFAAPVEVQKQEAARALAVKVTEAALSRLPDEAREQYEAYMETVAKLPTFEEAAKDLAERKPSFMLAEDVRVDPLHALRSRHTHIAIEPDAAAWVAWAEKSGTINPAIAELLRAAITKPEAEQTDGDVTHVLLTVEQATWLRRNIPYIRVGLYSVYSPERLRKQDLAMLDEIEQALTDRED